MFLTARRASVDDAFDSCRRTATPWVGLDVVWNDGGTAYALAVSSAKRAVVASVSIVGGGVVPFELIELLESWRVFKACGSVTSKTFALAAVGATTRCVYDVADLAKRYGYVSSSGSSLSHILSNL